MIDESPDLLTVTISIMVFVLVSMASLTILTYYIYPELQHYKELSENVTTDINVFCGYCDKHKDSMPVCCSGASCAGCCYMYHKEVLKKNVTWEECYAKCVVETLPNTIWDIKPDATVLLISLGISLIASIAVTIIVEKIRSKF